MAGRTSLQVVWFKRDLRASDNTALVRAARHGSVLPLHIVEPALWRREDASGRQFAFLAECLEDLSRALALLGQRLVIRVGEPVAVLEAIRSSHGIAALWSHQETGHLASFARDRAVASWARAHAIPWHEFPQDGVVLRLASRDGWAERREAAMSAPIVATPRALAPLGPVRSDPLPAAADLGLSPDACPARQRGGRAWPCRARRLSLGRLPPRKTGD
ncbi:deoxyribodipyrimidine photo-lyase [Oceanicella actignis]|nr:deoxyribodipyrimidine photo-lyase [Oceanicella actignis]